MKHTHTQKDLCPVRIEFDTPNASAASTFFSSAFLCVYTTLHGDFLSVLFVLLLSIYDVIRLGRMTLSEEKSVPSLSIYI